MHTYVCARDKGAHAVIRSANHGWEHGTGPEPIPRDIGQPLTEGYLREAIPHLIELGTMSLTFADPPSSSPPKIGIFTRKSELRLRQSRYIVVLVQAF